MRLLWGGGEGGRNASHRGNELQLAVEERGGGAFPLHDLRRDALLTLFLARGGGLGGGRNPSH